METVAVLIRKRKFHCLCTEQTLPLANLGVPLGANMENIGRGKEFVSAVCSPLKTSRNR